MKFILSLIASILMGMLTYLVAYNAVPDMAASLACGLLMFIIQLGIMTAMIID